MTSGKYIDNVDRFNQLSEMQRMSQGYPYSWKDPEIMAGRRRAKLLIQKYNTIDSASMDEEAERKYREELIFELFGSVKTNNFLVEPGFKCDYGSNIRLGDGVLINFGCVLLDGAPIILGDRVLLGPGVQLYTATHPTEFELRSEFGLAKKIVVGDDVWIGGHAVVCPGVTIGNRVTIAAGSIVTKDVPDDVMVAGNPAKIIRHFDPPTHPSKISKSILYK